jgi:hypothetical protein
MGVDAAGMFWVADTPPLPVLVGPTGFVSERDGTQVETFFRPFGDTFFGVNPNHVREELSVVAYAAAHPLAHGRRPVDGLGDGDQGHVVVVQGKCQCKLFSDNVSGCEISVLLRFDVVLPVGAAE